MTPRETREEQRVGGDTPQASPEEAAKQAAAAEGKPERAEQEARRAKGEKVEAGAAGHGAEPRGKHHRSLRHGWNGIFQGSFGLMGTNSALGGGTFASYHVLSLASEGCASARVR